MQSVDNTLGLTNIYNGIMVQAEALPQMPTLKLYLDGSRLYIPEITFRK